MQADQNMLSKHKVFMLQTGIFHGAANISYYPVNLAKTFTALTDIKALQDFI